MKQIVKQSLIGSGWKIFAFVTVGVSFWFVQPIAAADTTPTANPESRQLDFWIGNWSVAAPGSVPNAASVVHLELGKCLLIESWDGGRGHKGENMFAYGADDKSWHGMFTDNRGRVHVLTGKEIKPGLVEFSGTSSAEEMSRVRVTKFLTIRSLKAGTNRPITARPGRLNFAANIRANDCESWSASEGSG